MTFWIDTMALFVFTFGLWVGWWARGLFRRKDDRKPTAGRTEAAGDSNGKTFRSDWLDARRDQVLPESKKGRD